jgi:hypothetical protein
MKLLAFIRQVLDCISPKVISTAEMVAQVASVFASFSWLITQALCYLKLRLDE